MSESDTPIEKVPPGKMIASGLPPETWSSSSLVSARIFKCCVIVAPRGCWVASSHMNACTRDLVAPGAAVCDLRHRLCAGSHSDRVSARFLGGPLGQHAARGQNASATVSVPSSTVSCVCNTFARPQLVSLAVIRRPGADCFVVVRKRVSVDGAKGAGNRHGIGVNRQREESDVQWNAAAFARWHEPDDARVSSPVL